MQVFLRTLALAMVVAGLSVEMSAATLEKLALDEMVAKSTQIVRGRVLSVAPIRRGAVIHTQATVQVIERWKGSEGQTVLVSIPGGSMDGIRQNVAGAPEIAIGREYVFFLWAGPSKVNQIIGLSQGLLDLKFDAKGVDRKSVV